MRATVRRYPTRRATMGRRTRRSRPAWRPFAGAWRFRVLNGDPDLRVALARGRAMLYRWPWWAAGGPIFLAFVDPLSLGPLEPVQAGLDEPPPDELTAEMTLPPMTPPTPRPPGRVDLVEIKGLRSYRTGLRQLAARRQPAGDSSLVVYDDVGNVHMQVFGVRNGVRQIVWEGIIGRVAPPPRGGTVGHGNAMEPLIRPLVERTTGQTFLPHRANAPGPDLVMPGVAWR